MTNETMRLNLNVGLACRVGLGCFAWWLALPLAVLANNPREFLGPEVFSLQPLWDGAGATRLVTAHDGSVLVFRGATNHQLYRSPDGGRTWDTPRFIGSGASVGNAIVDETNGEVLVVVPSQSIRYRSTDHGLTWTAHSTNFGLDILGYSVGK